MENLKFDKRLASRRDWVTPSEQQSAIEALPDAEEKGEVIRVDAPAPSGDRGPAQAD